MKILFALMIAVSASAFANEKAMVGENASPEYKNCLAEDKCPSQRCANSCAMINSTQFKDDRSTASAAPKKNGKSKASAQ
ncbi:hypothetical protein ACJVC5_06355 [Peredibacter sp. HCB2-198]|uniref:hypothetical protein n=1 Tax=Peredibacter sp. HCB2-198 TaxID=3383025 RepID=UPI0038B677EE